MKKLLTIIVPSYNMEAFLDRSCASLGSSKTLEVLVVNDGSKDRTSEIAHQWVRRFPKVFKVIDKENGNYGSCINRGLREATGEFVRVLDADDYYETTALNEFLSFLTSVDAAGVDAVVSDYDMVDERGMILHSIRYDLPHDCVFGVKEILPMAKTLAMHGITYRTRLLREMAYHQTEGVSYTDNQWIILPFARVSKLWYFPKTVYHYYIGREGQSMKMPVNAKNVEMSTRMLEDLGRTYRRLKESMSVDACEYIDSYVSHLVSRVYSDFVHRVPLSDWRLAFVRYDSAIKKDLPSFYNNVRRLQIAIARRLSFCALLQVAYMALLRVAMKVRGLL